MPDLIDVLLDNPVPDAMKIRALAIDVLALAQIGSMPGSFWLTDQRINRACLALQVTPSEAQGVDWSTRTPW